MNFETLKRIGALEARVKALEDRLGETREELVRRFEEKFGRKPHHLLGLDKIKEALNGG